MNFILYGEQYPRIKQRLNALLKERLGTPDEFNVAKFDLDNTELSEVIFEASLLPLGYDRKAVIFDGVKFLSKGAKKDDVNSILELVQNPCDAIDLYFIVRESSIDDKSPIVQEISKNGQVLEFTNITDEQWPEYIRKFFGKRNVKIDEDAIEELISRIDGDLNRFLNEANKLCLYK